MRTVLLFIIYCLLLCSKQQLFAQGNVGIGINTATEKLHVDSGHVKIGLNAWGSVSNNKYLKFGDGDYVMLGEEDYDDVLTFKARSFLFKPSNGVYNGNVGIGLNILPTAKLHVIGSFRLENGSQGSGKILTSDLFGNTSWQTPPTPTPTQTLKVCIATSGIYPVNGGSGPAPEPYIGEIKIFPYSFVPGGWLECKGQLLPISTNVALFSLIGTTYGGDGITNFALPDLTGKCIIGQ